jgi:hypothetical protein
MISTLKEFEPRTAAGILARTALSLDDETNPAARSRIANEDAVRRALLDEVRSALGVSPTDNSAETHERIGDVLDKELDTIAGETDVDKVLVDLAAKGEIPSDLYQIDIAPNVKDVYEEKWYEERRLIFETVESADQEQHFSADPQSDEPPLVSLFTKFFTDKFAYRSFTMLVVGQRGDGVTLHVHQAWRLYADAMPLEGASDLVDLLRRFSEALGLYIEVDGVRTKFSLNQALPDEGTSRAIRVLPVYGTDNRGKKVEKSVVYVLSNFMVHRPDGSISAAMTNAIDKERYRSVLRAHGW